MYDGEPGELDDQIDDYSEDCHYHVKKQTEEHTKDHAKEHTEENISQFGCPVGLRIKSFTDKERLFDKTGVFNNVDVLHQIPMKRDGQLNQF